MKELLDLAQIHKDVTLRFWYAGNGIFCFNVSKQGRYVTKQITRDMFETVGNDIVTAIFNAAIAELESSMEDYSYERRTYAIND